MPHGAGLEVATHAIGDAAVGEALDAYAATGAWGSIEHAQLVRRDDVRRMADLGIRASVQPAHLLDDRDVTEKVWPDRADRCFAFRWMLDDGVDAGARVGRAGLAARPVAGDGRRGAPQRRRARAVARRAGADPREALAASVDGQPTVAPGSRGDLVLLDRDPLRRGRGLREQAAMLRDMRSTPPGSPAAACTARGSQGQAETRSRLSVPPCRMVPVIGMRSFWGALPTEGRWLLSTVAIHTLGRGVTLPFTIIYLHEVRGFDLGLSGSLMGLIAISGLDRHRAGRDAHRPVRRSRHAARRSASR